MRAIIESVVNLGKKSKALYYKLKNPGTGFFMLFLMALGKMPLLYLEFKDPATWSTMVAIYGNILNTLCLYASYLMYKSGLEMYYTDPPRKLTFFEVLTAFKNGFFGFFFELKELTHSYITGLFSAKTVKTDANQSISPVILGHDTVPQPSIAARFMPSESLDEAAPELQTYGVPPSAATAGKSQKAYQ